MLHLSTRQLLFIAIIGSVAVLPLLILPVMVGAIVDDLGLSTATAGWCASLTFFGGALVAITLSLVMHRIDLRRCAFVGLLLAAGADLTSGLIDLSATELLALRFISGMGAAGAAQTAVLSTIARTAHPGRGYSSLITLQFSISALGLYGLPQILHLIDGAKGIFLMMATLELFAATLSWQLPVIEHKEAPSSAGTSSLPNSLKSRAALLAIAGIALYEAAGTGAYAYVERIGTSFSFDAHSIGLSLGLASLLGIAGAFFSAFLGERYGTLRPLSFGVICSVTAMSILLNDHSYSAFNLANFLQGFSWGFTVPFLLTRLAELDSKGSVIAAGASAGTLGIAVGPGLAALVVDNNHYDAVLQLAIALFLMALAGILLSKKAQ